MGITYNLQTIDSLKTSLPTRFWGSQGTMAVYHRWKCSLRFTITVFAMPENIWTTLGEDWNGMARSLSEFRSGHHLPAATLRSCGVLCARTWSQRNGCQ